MSVAEKPSGGAGAASSPALPPFLRWKAEPYWARLESDQLKARCDRTAAALETSLTGPA